MSWSIKLSPAARLDIEQALEWTLDRFGPLQHDAYLALIGDALADIAADPNKAPAQRRPELHPDAWTFHIARRGRRARHLFVYRVTTDVTVEVARFLHDSMELTRHLPEEFSTDPADQ